MRATSRYISGSISLRAAGQTYLAGQCPPFWASLAAMQCVWLGHGHDSPTVEFDYVHCVLHSMGVQERRLSMAYCENRLAMHPLHSLFHRPTWTQCHNRTSPVRPSFLTCFTVCTTAKWGSDGDLSWIIVRIDLRCIYLTLCSTPHPDPVSRQSQARQDTDTQKRLQFTLSISWSRSQRFAQRAKSQVPAEERVSVSNKDLNYSSAYSTYESVITDVSCQPP
uniref:Uncharacterized protein n=1 Tax=Schistocephalus solidus TaxID=70667 RepID=A0A0X3NP31_SCHSO